MIHSSDKDFVDATRQDQQDNDATWRTWVDTRLPQAENYSSIEKWHMALLRFA